MMAIAQLGCLIAKKDLEDSQKLVWYTVMLARKLFSLLYSACRRAKAFYSLSLSSLVSFLAFFLVFSSGPLRSGCRLGLLVRSFGGQCFL